MSNNNVKNALAWCEQVLQSKDVFRAELSRVVTAFAKENRLCPRCGKALADSSDPDWPADFQPQGPDHVPPGFCNGIGCAPGAQGEPGLDLARVTLKKYIQHIGEVEGVDFIPENQADQMRHVVNHFTPEELALLHELRREILEKR
jgi:hypothetical protein